MVKYDYDEFYNSEFTTSTDSCFHIYPIGDTCLPISLHGADNDYYLKKTRYEKIDISKSSQSGLLSTPIERMINDIQRQRADERLDQYISNTKSIDSKEIQQILIK